MSGGKKASPGYQPTGQASADTMYQNLQGNLGAASNQLTGVTGPAYYANYAQSANNPNTAGFLSGAQQAGAAATATGQQSLGQSQALAALGGNYQSLAPGIEQTGFDPQSAYYNQMMQKTLDQQNAINAQYGVANSPYGANLAGQAANQFNMDWYGQQQARQNAAIQALSQLGSSVSGLYGQSAALGDQGATELAYGGQAPYAAQQTVNADQLAALNNLVSGITGSYGLANQGIQNAGQYMGIGQNATQIANQATAYNNQQQQALMQSIGQLIGSNSFAQQGLGAAGWGNPASSGGSSSLMQSLAFL